MESQLPSGHLEIDITCSHTLYGTGNTEFDYHSNTCPCTASGAPSPLLGVLITIAKQAARTFLEPNRVLFFGRSMGRGGDEITCCNSPDLPWFSNL